MSAPSDCEEIEQLDRLAHSLRTRGAHEARLVFVLGSGLGDFAQRLRGAISIPHTELDGMPESRVPGHAGRLVIGELGGVTVIAQQGRIHLYEGHSAQRVARFVRALTSLGCAGLVLTNAAGGIRPRWSPGTLMRIREHINLQAGTPLELRQAGRGSPYDERFGRALELAARDARVDLRNGIYAAMPGPSYETPAEIRMLAWMGADAVGMSTAVEALAAHAGGARVAGVSCITNCAAGTSNQPLSHEEVLAVGHTASLGFCNLLESSVPHLVAVLAS